MKSLGLLLSVFLCYTSLFAQSNKKTNQALLAKALNAHINYLNIISGEYGSGRQLRTYFNFNKSLNTRIKKSFETTSTKKSKYPLRIPRFNAPNKVYTYGLKIKTSLLKEINVLRQNIPEEDLVTITTLFDTIKKTIEYRRLIHKKLYELTKDNPYLEKNKQIVANIYSNLKLLDHTEKQARDLKYQFEKLSERTYRKYFPIINADNSWLKSAKYMQQALDTARVMLKKVRTKEFAKSKLIDTIFLSQTLSKLKLNKERNLKGIGRNTYEKVHDVHNDYHMFGRMLQKFIRDLSCNNCFSGNKGNGNYVNKLYNDAYYNLSSAVDYYNNFANSSIETRNMRIAPQFLLNKVTDFGWYELQPKPRNFTSTSIENLVIESYAFNHTVLLLDVSSSMNHPTKLPLIKNAIKQLSPHLREHDRLSVVIYSDDAKAIMKNVSFTDTEAIALLDKLNSRGKTNANKGLKLAFKIARSEFITGGNNRIILASDGDFKLTPKSFRQVKLGAEEDIVFSVFGFGRRITNEGQLKGLANAGKGHYQKITAKNNLKALLKELTAVKR